MEIETKYFFTVATIVVALVIALAVTPQHVDSGVGWTRGNRNLLRRMLYDSDGKLRKHAKLAVILYFVLFIGILWMF
jgi:hypothetical protein